MIIIVVTKHFDLDDREILGVVKTLDDAQEIVDRFDHERPADEFWADSWRVGGVLVDTRQLTKRKRSKPWEEGEPTVLARNPFFRQDT